MEGWIKLHRRITKWEWFEDAKTLQLFLYLLAMAQHKDTRWKGIEVSRGQLVTGLHSLKKGTGQSLQSIRTRLKHLKSTGEITSKSTNEYTIITINSYDSYNDKEDETNKQTNKQTNKPVTNEQQTTNNMQECKEQKNEKKKKEYVQDSDELRLANLLFDYKKQQNTNMVKPNLQTWANTIGLIIRQDKQTAQTIEEAINWTQTMGNWWNTKTNSPEALRRSWNTITTQMRKAGGSDNKLVGTVPYVAGQKITVDDF